MFTPIAETIICWITHPTFVYKKPFANFIIAPFISSSTNSNNILVKCNDIDKISCAF